MAYSVVLRGYARARITWAHFPLRAVPFLNTALYKWSSGVTISSYVTLSGSSSDVWIFQIAGTLYISSATQVILGGGAQTQKIFWQVAGQATLKTTAVFYGNILCKTAIVIDTGAKPKGRALAQTAVTLDSNAIVTATSQQQYPNSVLHLCCQPS